MESLLPRAVDSAIFFGYSLLMWQTVQTWFCLKKTKKSKRESTLSALIVVMAFSILAFVFANAYMLYYLGETLLTMRLFQIFVMANFFVYWLILNLLKKEAVDDAGGST